MLGMVFIEEVCVWCVQECGEQVQRMQMGVVSC